MNSWEDDKERLGAVLSSKVLLARNFSNLPFPNKLNYIKVEKMAKKYITFLKTN